MAKLQAEQSKCLQYFLLSCLPVKSGQLQKLCKIIGNFFTSVASYLNGNNTQIGLNYSLK